MYNWLGRRWGWEWSGGRNLDLPSPPQQWSVGRKVATDSRDIAPSHTINTHTTWVCGAVRLQNLRRDTSAPPTTTAQLKCAGSLLLGRSCCRLRCVSHNIRPSSCKMSNGAKSAQCCVTLSHFSVEFYYNNNSSSNNNTPTRGTDAPNSHLRSRKHFNFFSDTTMKSPTNSSNSTHSLLVEKYDNTAPKMQRCRNVWMFQDSF